MMQRHALKPLGPWLRDAKAQAKLHLEPSEAQLRALHPVIAQLHADSGS